MTADFLSNSNRYEICLVAHFAGTESLRGGNCITGGFVRDGVPECYICSGLRFIPRPGFFVYRGEFLVGLVGLTHAHTWLTAIRGGRTYSLCCR